MKVTNYALHDLADTQNATKTSKKNKIMIKEKIIMLILKEQKNL